MAIKPFSWPDNKVTGEYLALKPQNVWCPARENWNSLQVACKWARTHIHDSFLISQERKRQTQFDRKAQSGGNCESSSGGGGGGGGGGFWAISFYSEYKSPKPSVDHRVGSQWMQGCGLADEGCSCSSKGDIVRPWTASKSASSQLWTVSSVETPLVLYNLHLLPIEVSQRLIRNSWCIFSWLNWGRKKDALNCVLPP